MTRVTAYSLHLIFILYILFSSLYLIVFFNSTHSAVSDHNRNQKLKIKYTQCCITDRCTEHLTLSIEHILETVSKICYSEIMCPIVCVSSIDDHKQKYSVTVPCIHKVQVFNVRTQTTKDSHRKKFQSTYSRGKFLHEAQFLRMLTVS